MSKITGSTFLKRQVSTILNKERQNWKQEPGSYPSECMVEMRVLMLSLETIGSPYNRARRQESYTVYSSGLHEHEGDEGYFGKEVAQDDGKTYIELTLK
ncbi:MULTISPECIES: hypothetical protein [unclassified Anabaena]|uniref:hypothetical protein n=1 Tax=unclassified Anabaena TaxID=2619674 RepID=UPI0039C65E54